MTERTETTPTRRTVLAAVATGGLAGCLSTETDTPPEQSVDTAGRTGTATATATSTVQSTSPTETESPSPTDSSTPTRTPIAVHCWDAAPEQTPTPTDGPADLNATDYLAAWPLAPENEGSTSSLYDVIDGEESAVFLRTREQWRRLRKSLTEATGESFENYEFATRTTFETESIVAFQTTVSDGGARVHLAAVTGVGTGTPQLCTWDGSGGGNAAPTRLLLVRLPDDGSEPIRPVVAHRTSRTSEESETYVAEPYD